MGLGLHTAAFILRERHLHDAVGMGERRLQGIRETLLEARLHHQAVHHDVDVVLFLLVEGDLLGEVVGLAVDDDPDEAVLSKLRQFLFVLPLPAAHDRGEQGQLCPLGERRDLVHHLRHRLRRDEPAAVVAVRLSDAGEEQAEVIVDFGDGSHRRPGVLAGSLLFDGDGRGESLDRFDVGFLHLLQELPCIGGEGLDVAPLPLRVDGVEGERRFPRAGYAGDDHELVARDFDVDAFEVVLAGTLYDDLVRCHDAPDENYLRGAPGARLLNIAHRPAYCRDGTSIIMRISTIPQAKHLSVFSYPCR